MASNQDKLSNQVRENTSRISDEDLLGMLNGKRSDYTSFAWEVAQQELSKRGGREAVELRLAEEMAEEDPVEQAPTYNGVGLRCDVYKRDDYAGYWIRGLANAIDGIILGVALSLLSTLGETLGPILGLILFATYHVGFKGARGTTPGYMVLGIRIVSMDGADPTISQIVVRQISSVFSGMTCGLGFFWIAFDASKQSWHDKIAGTYVVKAKAKPFGAIGILRTRVVRVRLFVTLLLLTGAFIISSYVGIIMVLKTQQGSEAYHSSEEYLKTDSRIRQEIGNPSVFDLIEAGNPWSNDEREYTIRISGDQGEITAKTIVKQVGGRWVVTEAGFVSGDGHHVDITKPFTERK